MHRLLERQLKKSFGRSETFSPDIRRFLDLVDAAYRESDEDRALLDRSMKLSSQELFERNANLIVAEQKYRAIFENATEGIFQATADGRFISCNPALARIFGYDDPEQLQAMVTDIPTQIYVDPMRRDEIVQEIHRHGGVSQCESQARRKDGAIIWISETTRVVLTPDGSAERYEGTIHDVSKRKHAEVERQMMQDRLVATRQSGMAEVATGVLHNIGNVLNSINVSTSLVTDRMRQSKLPGLAKAVQIVLDHRDDLAGFLAEDTKGKQIPDYLGRVMEHLQGEQKLMLHELASLTQNLEHVKRIVDMQQEYAKVSGASELLMVSDLVEDALRLCKPSFERERVDVVRTFEPLPEVNSEKHQIMQILVNLISNARYAMSEGARERRLTVRVGPSPRNPRMFIILVRDTGIGIPKENLTRIFNHGFTTKASGHGFGLHSAALAAHAMGGALTAASDGPGTGAAFTLELPMTPPAKSDRSDRSDRLNRVDHDDREEEVHERA